MRAKFRSVAAMLLVACASAAAAAVERRAERIAEGVYVLRPAGEFRGEDRHRPANAAFVVGPRGVAVIDTGVSYRDGVDILAAIARVTPRRVRVAILTHPGAAAIFGAAAFQDRGVRVVMHRDAAALVAARCESCLHDWVATFGEDAMAFTRVIRPDRVIERDTTDDSTGRRLRLLAPARSSAPGALAVLDERTSTLFGGSIIATRSVPDLRDGDAPGWRHALAALAATRCRHLVPGYGAAGRCADIEAFARYLADLEDRVAALLREGVGLAELDERCDLPAYSSWERYEALHRANAVRVYLRLERDLFEMR
jgi:glyoxylase-like metal-dependent hydrolase (beta-lactamase superfamily II)